MTENNLLATAAAAIVHRMIKRRRPLVFLPLSPSKKNFAPSKSVAMVRECEVVEAQVTIGNASAAVVCASGCVYSLQLSFDLLGIHMHRRELAGRPETRQSKFLIDTEYACVCVGSVAFTFG